MVCVDSPRFLGPPPQWCQAIAPEETQPAARRRHIARSSAATSFAWVRVTDNEGRAWCSRKEHHPRQVCSQTKTPGPWTRRSEVRLELSLGLRLRPRGGPAAGVGHDLTELRLVLGLTQPVEEFFDLALFLLEPAKRLLAIFVEGAVAAREAAPGAAAPAAHGLAHAVPAFLVPAAVAVLPTSHASTPYNICQDAQADRPVGHEAEDHEHDPCRLTQVIELCGDAHRRS